MRKARGWWRLCPVNPRVLEFWLPVEGSKEREKGSSGGNNYGTAVADLTFDARWHIPALRK